VTTGYVRLLRTRPAGLRASTRRAASIGERRPLPSGPGAGSKCSRGMTSGAASSRSRCARRSGRSLRSGAGRRAPESIGARRDPPDPDGSHARVHGRQARPGGGADVLSSTRSRGKSSWRSWPRRRSALSRARKPAAETIESTTRELESSVERIVSAVRRAARRRSGALQRAAAEGDARRDDPRVPEAPQAARTAPDGPTPPRGRKPPRSPRGGHEENRELLTHMLRSRGAEVVACGSGREASRRPHAGALVRGSRLQMPEMDGTSPAAAPRPAGRRVDSGRGR